MLTNTPHSVRLIKLLQLASPALPVGAYSYSQGLESAIEAGIVHDAQSAQRWINDVLELTLATTDAPLLLRLCANWESVDYNAMRHWNDCVLATRESAELRAETVQMGYSLRRLLSDIVNASSDTAAALHDLDEVAYPTAYAYAVAHWQIDPTQALTAYLWSWAENQVMAALKAVPLGQTDGQKILLALGERLPLIATQATQIPDDGVGSFAPGLAILSAQHETQYSRLFRS